MNVLITSFTLRYRMGAEIYVRDLALELQRQGHSPAIYAPTLGPIADELQAAHIPVYTKLRDLAFRPDIIHGNFRRETLSAVLRFRDVPAISVCHTHAGWGGGAPIHPQIRRYLGMSRLCVQRLLAEGISQQQIQIAYNFVDLHRFQPRRPLPERPQRALLFSNYATAETHLPAVVEACRQAGLPLNIVGAGVGNSVTCPETLLGDYDLVFAKAKAAIEAMAVGTAVILCDFGGVGPLVTAEEFPRLRPLNFGFEALQEPLEPAALLRQIARYESKDAAEVSQLMRESAGLEFAVKDLVTLYEDVIREHSDQPVEPIQKSWRYTKVLWRETILEQILIVWVRMPQAFRIALSHKPVFVPLKKLIKFIFRS